MATEAELNEIEASLQQRLRDVYGASPWIVAGGVAQGVDPSVRLVLELGASQAIGLATRVGVGELSNDIRIIISDDAQVGDDVSLITRMHDGNRELHDPPAWVLAEIDEWDPAHKARVLIEPTMEGGVIAGRPTFGARRPEWAALEDKISIRDLWDRAGIATAPDLVVETSDAGALLAAHEELATQWGTVWAADNEQGWHGGGHGTHWVSTVAAAEELAATISNDHRHVRVQPFLEGVPCSIHGMVLGDATLAFRPCEMLMLLDPVAHEFVYSRAATFWDPADADRESMRSTARAIGDQLRATVDYRGVFTVDGVLTRDGFLPTEVNPRFGAALPPLLPTADGQELSVFFTHLAATAGQLDDFDPALLEALLVDRLDQHREGSAFILTPDGPTGDEKEATIAGTWDGDRFVDLALATGDDAPFISATWGASPGGGLIFGTWTSEMPIGPPVAPTLVEVRRFLSRHWGLGLGEVHPAFAE